MPNSKLYMIDDIGTDIKTFFGVLLTWLVGVFIDNPVGTATSIVGLLYVYEAWRTKKLERKKLKRELDKDD